MKQSTYIFFFLLTKTTKTTWQSARLPVTFSNILDKNKDLFSVQFSEIISYYTFYIHLNAFYIHWYIHGNLHIFYIFFIFELLLLLRRIDFTKGFTCIFNFGLHWAVFRVEGNNCKVFLQIIYIYFPYILNLSVDNYCYCYVTIFLHLWSSRPQVTFKK